MDDDVILNFKYLNILLNKHKKHSKRECLLCNVLRSNSVIRDIADKWYIPTFLYPNKTYPDQCEGPMYILSVPALKKIKKLFEEGFRNNFIWLEDVYLTGNF